MRFKVSLNEFYPSRSVRYDSIRFGLENSPSPLEVLNTETGESLGGKKAAIQFYYDRRQTDLTS